MKAFAVRCAALAALALGVASARAQAPVDASLTLGTTPVQVLAAARLNPGGSGLVRQFVLIEVNSAANVACSWTSTSPAVWGAGSFTLQGQGSNTAYVQQPFVPQSALWCVASAGSTSLTVLVYPG